MCIIVFRKKVFFTNPTENTLLHGPVRPALLRYALPIILSMVATQFYSVADTMIIGLRLDADALAAVSNASTVLMIFLFISGGMELGGGLLVAAGRPTATRQEMAELLYNLLFVDLVLALGLTALGFFTLPALLGLLLLAAPLHAAYGTESGTPPFGDMEWKGEASTPSRRCPTLPFDGELTLGAGGSVSSSPYKGYGPDWLPFPMITYEGERFFIRGYTAGVKIINLPYLELSAFAGYDSTSFEASESSNRRLRRLEDRSPSAQAGMELRLLSPYGMFHASGAGDVLSRSNGFNGDIGFIQSIEFGPLELLPAVGAYWSDARYNSYYYGVTRKEARKSGLGAYAPGSGFAPYVSFAIDYSLTEQWELFCQGEVTFLSGAVKDSPMVGETHTQSLTLGLTYTF